jgi:hypothetical protein
VDKKSVFKLFVKLSKPKNPSKNNKKNSWNIIVGALEHGELRGAPSFGEEAH